ncbi:MAG: porin family protein [Muribaculaceae bacterium]|nr:porin family protein [Muribaculaceae bacterium]
MRKVFFALLGVLCLSAQPMSAQNTSVEVLAGMNLSSMSSLDSKIGFHAGVRIGKDLPSVFNGAYINGAALLSLKGAEKDYGDLLDVNFNAYYLEIPVHFGYKYVFNENVAVFGEFGPYFSFGLFGKASVASMGDKAKVDTFSDEGGVNRFDFGLGFRLGVELSNRVPISVGYDFGLVNVAKEVDEAVRNSNLTLSIGYKF